MQILQNVACLEVTLNPADKRINISSDILRGKKINAIYMFSSPEDTNYKSPFSDTFLTTLEDISDYGFYLNLVDNKGNHFLKDFAVDNFLISRADDYYNICYSINRILDFDKCYINYIGNAVDPIKLLIYVFYQTQNYTRITDEISGSITVAINPTSSYEDIPLDSIINETLKFKKIKQILFNGNGFGYLDIVGVNHTLENIPNRFFELRGPKSIYLDAVQINFEKSYWRQRGNYYIQQYLTFIY